MTFSILAPPAVKRLSANCALPGKKCFPWRRIRSTALACMIASDARASARDVCVLVGRSPRAASGWSPMATRVEDDASWQGAFSPRGVALVALVISGGVRDVSCLSRWERHASNEIDAEVDWGRTLLGGTCRRSTRSMRQHSKPGM